MGLLDVLNLVSRDALACALLRASEAAPCTNWIGGRDYPASLRFDTFV